MGYLLVALSFRREQDDLGADHLIIRRRIFPSPGLKACALTWRQVEWYTDWILAYRPPLLTEYTKDRRRIIRHNIYEIEYLVEEVGVEQQLDAHAGDDLDKITGANFDVPLCSRQSHTNSGKQ